MELYVLDKQYETVGMIDEYFSLIWTERYNGYGEFSVEVPYSSDALDFVKKDFYVFIDGRPNVYMVIETIEVDTNVEKGAVLKIEGRSLESVLCRRRIASYLTIDGKFQNGVKSMIDSTVISPSDASRKIENFIFTETEEDPIVNADLVGQYLGTSVYETIYAECDLKGFGFKVLPYGDGGFNFMLYNGEDRSYDQDKNFPVVFSPEYDNLLSSSFISSKKNYSNYVYISGDGDGNDQVVVGTCKDSEVPSGLDRYEAYVSGSGVSRKDSDGEEITDERYESLLKSKGLESLPDLLITDAFDGEVVPEGQYVYGVDFDIGDIVQVENEYGMTARCRITEIVWTHDESGLTVTPTFIKLEDE